MVSEYPNKFPSVVVSWVSRSAEFSLFASVDGIANFFELYLKPYLAVHDERHLQLSVSKLCKDVYGLVDALSKRSRVGDRYYLWRDAPYLKFREGGWILSAAAISALTVTTEGKCEIVGLASRERGRARYTT